jgi:hypothetical protein
MSFSSTSFAPLSGWADVFDKQNTRVDDETGEEVTQAVKRTRDERRDDFADLYAADNDALDVDTDLSVRDPLRIRDGPPLGITTATRWAEPRLPGSSYLGTRLAMQAFAQPRPVSWEAEQIARDLDQQRKRQLLSQQVGQLQPTWNGVPVVRNMLTGAATSVPMQALGGSTQPGTSGNRRDDEHIFVLQKEVNYKLVPVSAAAM